MTRLEKLEALVDMEYNIRSYKTERSGLLESNKNTKGYFPELTLQNNYNIKAISKKIVAAEAEFNQLLNTLK